MAAFVDSSPWSIRSAGAASQRCAFSGVSLAPEESPHLSQPFHGYRTRLRACCKCGDAEGALDLIRRARGRSLSPFKADDYMLALVSLAEGGHFGGENGAELFNEIASDIDLASRACEILPESALRLHNSLTKAFGDVESTTEQGHEEGKQRERIPFRDSPVNGDKVVSCRAEVDPRKRRCPVTDVMLSSSTIEPEKRRQMLEEVVASGGKQALLVVELSNFADWMNARKGPSFTAIIDGAHVDDIGTMVSTLKERERFRVVGPAARRERILVLLPKDRRVSKTLMRAAARNRVCIYTVPQGHEDLFCAFATLLGLKQTQHRSAETGPILISGNTFESLPTSTSDMIRCRYTADDVANGKLPRSDPLSSVQAIDTAKKPRHLAFSMHERQAVYRDLLELVPKAVATDLAKFAEFLNTREGRPFTIILDGANVGDIRNLVSRLERHNGSLEHVLCVFPEKNRYARQAAKSMKGNTQNCFYMVPDGLEDDLFCLVATLVDQERSYNKYPGPRMRTLLITNDRFRDHKQYVRDRALFRKWYACHCSSHIDAGRRKRLPKDSNVFKPRIESTDDDMQARQTTPFSPDQLEQMTEDLLDLAKERSQAENELGRFVDFMSAREGHPFTVILDGAFEDVELMLSDLEEEGECPLVLFDTQVASERQGVIYRLQRRGNFYVIPESYDAKLFYVMATLVDQKRARNNSREQQEPVCPVLVTKEKLIERQQNVMDPALFREWRRHHYYKQGDGMLKFLPVLRRKIECNDGPSSNGGNASTVWHFPVFDWSINERYVVRLPR
ncbi:hypothetical protein ACHAXT_009063 [Thalassiosira profunda]